MNITLTVISPYSAKNVLIDWLDIETLTGSLVIKAGYTPTYFVLKKDSIVTWQLATGAVEKIKINNGFVEVQRDRIVLLRDRDDT